MDETIYVILKVLFDFALEVCIQDIYGIENIIFMSNHIKK